MKSNHLLHYVTVIQEDEGVSLVMNDPDYKPFHTDIVLPAEEVHEFEEESYRDEEYVVEKVIRKRYNGKEG